MTIDPISICVFAPAAIYSVLTVDADCWRESPAIFVLIPFCQRRRRRGLV